MPKGERVIMLLIMATAIAAGFISLGFEMAEARNFPLITGITLTVIILLYFAVVASPRWSKRLRAFIQDDMFLKIHAANDMVDQVEEEATADEANDRSEQVKQLKERTLIGYVVGFGVLGWVVGLTVGVPVFMMIIMTRYSKEPPKGAAVVAIATSLSLYLMFTVILRLPPHFGLLARLF